MPYSRPTLQEIIDRIISDFNNRISASITFLRRSVFRIFGYAYGAAVYLLYDYINYVKDQLFIATADAEHLDTHGAEYNFYRDSGSQATGTISITGTAGTSIPAGTELKTSDGLVYKTDSAVTIGSGGTVDADITAEAVGTDYNQAASATLTFVSPLANVDSTATIDSSGIQNGEDAETDDEFRARLLQRKRQPPHGGAQGDYETWALEYPGVTRAWEIPEYQGAGTIGVSFVMDDATPIYPSSATREAVKNYIISHTDSFLGTTVGCPVTAQPGLFIIPNSGLTVNFDISIYPNTTDNQDAAEVKLKALIEQSGGAERTITISQIYEAVMDVNDILRCRVNTPDADVTATAAQVHEYGSFTWGDY